jgi:CYTH domain-containing protein
VNLEIERRFLINESNFMPPKLKKSIKQAYLFSDSNQVLRVRVIENEYYLNFNLSKISYRNW